MKTYFRICISLILFSIISISLSAQRRIKMEKEGSMYYIPCEVNGLKLRFLFDTGASSVCLSLTEAQFMLKNGYLDENDLGGKSKAEIADGTLVDLTKVNLREIKIGTLKLTNIRASIVHTQEASLLLGQSAIEQLGRYYFEDDYLVIMPKKRTKAKNKEAKNTNIISKKVPKSTQSSKQSTSIREELDYANKLYNEDDNEQAHLIYDELYTQNPDCFDVDDLGKYLNIIWRKDDYKKTRILSNHLIEEYYLLTNKTKTNKINYSLAHTALADTYISSFEDLNKGKDLLKKVIIFNKNNNLEKANIPNSETVAIIYNYEGDCENAIEYQSLAFTQYINDKYGSNSEYFKASKIKGFRDKELGSIIFQFYKYYIGCKDEKNAKTMLLHATLCGNEEAIRLYNKQNKTSKK